MELISLTRPTGAVLAYGASLHSGGTRLRCGLLLVCRGRRGAVVTLRNPLTKQKYRVRLPREFLGQKGHAAAKRITLEVL